MQFFVALATLAALAVAAPAAEEVNLNRVASRVPAVEEASIAARQTYPGCNNGVAPGQYGCYANIANPNDRFSYLGQCGTDGNTHVIARCNCQVIGGQPFCV